MARQLGLVHIEKSSLASALDRAGSTLWRFPRRLALKNPPAVTLVTLEKCGNSGSGWGPDGTGRIRVAKNNGDNKREF
ncbi:hypothetical protein TNCT_220761 [Trichonephila clavata]|uniref:Uncharacterized protein n=1 Tax=Trichonephila clavata TaxID=2740835 RepID=A0A8X6G6H4_TRICU|nr:hypothetical protein TNCT_220761 [Trichonephila clavata]